MTKFKLGFIAAFSASVLLVGCNSAEAPSKSDTPMTQEAISEQAVADMAEMKPTDLLSKLSEDSNALADKLAAVNDEASAREAAKAVRAMGPKIEAMGKRFETMDQGEFSISLKTISKIQEAGKAQLRVAQEIARIAKDHPEFKDIITDEFGDLELTIK